MEILFYESYHANIEVPGSSPDILKNFYDIFELFFRKDLLLIIKFLKLSEIGEEYFSENVEIVTFYDSKIKYAISQF